MVQYVLYACMVVPPLSLKMILTFSGFLIIIDDLYTYVLEQIHQAYVQPYLLLHIQARVFFHHKLQSVTNELRENCRTT